MGPYYWRKIWILLKTHEVEQGLDRMMYGDMEFWALPPNLGEGFWAFLTLRSLEKN